MPTKTESKTEAITISAPNLPTVEFLIRGTAPYMQHKFSEKAKETIAASQKAGSQSRSRKKREPKDFEANYKAATYISREGWHGIPAPAIRSAMIDACRLVGFKMTHAKISVFVEADGFDATDGKPLVKITEGEPHMDIGAVRNETGVADLRARPMWNEGWAALVRITFDADQFSVTDVSNLLLRAGLQVGIGEGRNNSKKSYGIGFGSFKIENQQEAAA